MEFVEAGSKYPLASSVINVIEFYYTPALVAFGALGNCLSVYVVFATKMRRTSSSFYLAALALSDTGFLLSVLVNWLGLYYDVQILNQQGFCQFLVYLTNVCSFLSSWCVCVCVLFLWIINVVQIFVIGGGENIEIRRRSHWWLISQQSCTLIENSFLKVGKNLISRYSITRSLKESIQ